MVRDGVRVSLDGAGDAAAAAGLHRPAHRAAQPRRHLRSPFLFPPACALGLELVLASDGTGADHEDGGDDFNWSEDNGERGGRRAPLDLGFGVFPLRGLLHSDVAGLTFFFLFGTKEENSAFFFAG